MKFSRMLALLLLVAPTTADAAGRAPVAPQPTETRSVSLYHLQSHQLDPSASQAEVIFEYRDGTRVVARDTVQVDLDATGEAWVTIPTAGLGIWRSAELAQPELHVYSGQLLLDVLTPQTLAARDRQLRLTHGAGLDALRVAQPGEPDQIVCDSPCGGTCTPTGDYDCDGVINSVDNCTDDYNPSQANCDGDNFGDACDFNGIFQPTGPVETCMTDKDTHIGYITWEHHVEQRQVDVSACNQPDHWNRWIREDGFCTTNVSDPDCCYGNLASSLVAMGDSPLVWCDVSPRRNIDYCQ